MEPKLKIVMISSEVVPFAKTGGLADVVGALPQVLQRMATPCCPTRRARRSARLSF